MRKKVFKIGGALCVLTGLAIVALNLNNRSKNVKRHHVNPDHINMMQPKKFDLTVEPKDEKWLMKDIHDSYPAGRLVCEKRKSIPPGALSDEPLDFKSIPKARLKSIHPYITRLNPNRWIGCCPPGDPRGMLYKVGSACCVNEVFDASTHFCCMENSRVLQLNTENLDYCHPPDGASYCRMRDLEEVGNKGMKFRCELDHRNKPVHCEFQCPTGSKPKNGVTSASCVAGGVFDRIPECCQGCQEDFELNVIFLLQISTNQSRDDVDIFRTFLKKVTSSFKIGKKHVAIGYWIVGSDNDKDIYTNATEAIRAIDILHLEEGNGTLEDSMRDLATEGLRRINIERPGVNNLVAAVVQKESPSDAFRNAAHELNAVARVIYIGTGDGISNITLSAISRASITLFHVPNIANLADINDALHDKVCGTDCI